MSCSKTLDSYSKSSELIHGSFLCVWIFSPQIKTFTSAEGNILGM